MASLGIRAAQAVVATWIVATSAPYAAAFCGCDKPPPPRAAVRPFAGYADETITLFDDRLQPGAQYTVQFVARDGSNDWDQTRAIVRRDFADGQPRAQLRVNVPDISYGPAQLNVVDQTGTLLYSLSDDQFTVIAPPIALHDFNETITRGRYQTGVGADGTIYFAFDLSEMSDATTYTGVAQGLGLRISPENVAIYNNQGFYGGGLDPKSPGLFQLTPGAAGLSDTLAYWRHEFRTYKDDHRKRDAHRTLDGEWHADGTPHVDNYHLVVAVAATLDDGSTLTPGATPVFRLVLTASPAGASPL